MNSTITTPTISRRNEKKDKQKTDPVEFLIQRAAAYQAYYEMMPLRKESIRRVLT